MNTRKDSIMLQMSTPSNTFNGRYSDIVKIHNELKDNIYIPSATPGFSPEQCEINCSIKPNTNKRYINNGEEDFSIPLTFVLLYNDNFKYIENDKHTVTVSADSDKKCQDILVVGSKDLFSSLYLNTTPLVQLPAHWKGTKDMIYACDKDGNLVDPKVIFHGEVNTASVSGEEASKPKQSKEIVSYEFTPKYTNTQIYFETTKEKDMFTAERSHVSYSVVNEIVHTEGDEYLCTQFNNGFTEIVKSFERDKTDNEQITDAIRTYCSSDLLPETFSIGRAYIVRREVTYYKYFAPDTITALAELKVQYEKHKEYINSPECNPKPKETSYFIAVPYAVTSNHDVSCYTIPLNSAVLEYHIKTSSIYVNSKYAEYETAYNKMRNNNIRWKLNNPTSDFEIILEDLNLKDAIINNFQRWLTNTNQVSTPKINSTSRVLNEAAFRISRYFNRIKYSPCGDFKNILHETDIPIVSSSDTSLDYGVVPKFEMSVKDIQNGDEVTEENYFIKVEYALKENNPFGAISAKEMFTLEDISSMQIATILLSNYTEYTKTHNEKIVKIKDGVIQSRLDSTPYQLYMHKDTQEMCVQNGEFSFLPAAPFFAEKEEKIMDKQYFDEVDQEDIALTQGKHAVHFAMGNNLLPERWDARDYHFNLAQVAANVATADTLEESRHIKHSKQFNDYFQQYTSNQVKQTTINNIMIGM